ncbi:MAG: hypothetical protein B5766_11590 [Candidatus Lumbricidophila eiseniae]|uniref:Secreted protein n=1 Tax=Candidatus Lumbricidiphila eiseniae TaxID=1969409 RepID=A0A2A6FPR1_9MICO|nr:MAG: hypothetical protein B5766_11590 [Candidatus Lumbricidophila eiseniae]
MDATLIALELAAAAAFAVTDAVAAAFVFEERSPFAAPTAVPDAAADPAEVRSPLAAATEVGGGGCGGVPITDTESDL